MISLFRKTKSKCSKIFQIRLFFTFVNLKFISYHNDTYFINISISKNNLKIIYFTHLLYFIYIF